MKKLKDFFVEYFFYFFIYAIFGWLYEIILFLIVDHKFINRGFLFGPYLPVYGFGAILLIYILRKNIVKKRSFWQHVLNIIFVFIVVFIITTVVEYIAHYVLDTYFDIILWDYSHDYWNINGRVCFAASRNFAIGGTFLALIVQPWLFNYSKKYPYKKRAWISLILFAFVIIDFIISITYR